MTADPFHIDPRTITALKADIARQSFRHFIEYVQPDFLFNWHHFILIDALERLARREFTQLIITMPPRHSKSEVVSRLFPAWIFARNPDERVVLASYALGLAASMGKDCQRIMSTPAYRELFPNARLADSVPNSEKGGASQTSKQFDIVGAKGYYMPVGVGGGLTGFGYTVGIIDDPVKNEAEADSETYRNNTEGWYNSTFKTRDDPNAVEIICQTRWHEDDLTGRILKKHEPGRLQISFPAIAETQEENRQVGEALWESRYSRASLLHRQSVIGSRAWNALYQQRPAPQEGNIIKRTWFNYYDPRTLKIEGRRVNFYFDTAYTDKEQNDPTAGIAYIKEGADYYVLDCDAKYLEFLESMEFVEAFAKRNGYSRQSTIRVEPKATGKSLVQVMKKQTALNIVEGKPPKGDKTSRVNQCAGIFEAGRVHLPEGMAWVGSFLDECAAFPNGAHDDMVDCLTGMILSDGRGFGIHYG